MTVELAAQLQKSEPQAFRPTRYALRAAGVSEVRGGVVGWFVVCGGERSSLNWLRICTTRYALGAPIAEKKLILAWVGRARILAMRIVENDTGAKEIDAEIFP